MNRIATFAEGDISNLWMLGIAQLHIELDDDGAPLRELGLDVTGVVVHRHPGRPTVARYGLFDLQQVEAASTTDGLSTADFARLWDG